MLQHDALQNAINTYVNDYSREKNLSERTIRNKRNQFRRLFAYLGNRPLTLENTKAYFDQLRSHGVSANSIKTEIKNMRAFLSYLFRKKMIIENFGQELVIPKVPLVPEPLVPAETMEKIILEGTEPGPYDHALHREIKEEMRLALRFALRTGLRISELLHLSGTDLNLFDEIPQFAVHNKGGGVSILPLPLDLVEDLKVRVQNKRLFKVTQEGCSEALKRGAKRLKIPIRVHLHMLRKIYCTSMMRNGASLPIVSRLMRHSDVGLTHQIYSQYNTDDLSHTLNAFHPLVRAGRPKDQVFESVEELVKKLVGKDTRFKLTIDRSTNSISIKVSSETKQ